MDIGSGSAYPASALSNFAPHPFVLDGVSISSMEGFLQSLKFKNPEMQKHVCSLVGRAAKSKGHGKNWRRTGTLWWNGQEIGRFSEEYQELLDRAFTTLYTTNNSARKALLASGSSTLQHSKGKKSPRETVLTRNELCSRLTRIRAQLKETAAH